MSERLTVDAPGRLLDFLRRGLAGWKRKTLEQRLREGCVQVNGATVTRREHALAAGDVVRVLPEGQGKLEARLPAGLSLLHEDEELVAVDKPAGLLSVATEQQREKHALALVRDALST